MARGNKDSGSAVGGLIFLIVLIALVPKWVWITLGVAVGVAVVIWLIYAAWTAYEKDRAAAEKRARLHREAEAARARQQRIETLGADNAALVESAQAAVKRVVASEAARAGWLGDVDFTADIQAITDNFQKAYALSKVAEELSALADPSVEDRVILAEARTTAANLETAAVERVELIAKCASEARLIDDSLRKERADAKTAEQRAQLHAKLSAMLYGIEAAPDAAPIDSAVDSVMARVAAYREIKNQIQRARDAG